MAGHVDSRVLIRAPLARTWEVANQHETGARHGGGHDVVARDPARRAVVLHITTPPDGDGRVWAYDVERVQDPERHTVYARRFNNPHFRYSHALWLYREVDGGSEIRCVQDFEMAAGAPVDERRMEQILQRATEAALRKTAEVVEAAG